MIRRKSGLVITEVKCKRCGDKFYRSSKRGRICFNCNVMLPARKVYMYPDKELERCGFK